MFSIYFIITTYFFTAQRSNGGVILKAVAIKRHPGMNLNHINIEESSLSNSHFKRKSCRKWQATTCKVLILEELKKEKEELFL